MLTIALLSFLIVAPVRTAVASAPPHDRAFWQRIAAAAFAVPAGESAVDLLHELSGYVGSTDPEMRDELGYSITAVWVYQKRLIPPDSLRAFLSEWTANLRIGIGERGTESVFRRSFSALDLSVLAALDNASPFLADEEFHRLLGAALAYLDSEKDLRAFDEREGWIHATAHTADLLKFLARSAHLKHPDQAAILRAVQQRLTSADVAYTHGECERLARVVLSLAARPDVDAGALREWLAALPAPPVRNHVTEAELIARENVKTFLSGLFAMMSSAPGTPAVPGAAFRADVLKRLQPLL